MLIEKIQIDDTVKLNDTNEIGTVIETIGNIVKVQINESTREVLRNNVTKVNILHS